MSLHHDGRLGVVIHVVAGLSYGGVERRMETLASTLDRSRNRHIFCSLSLGGAAEKSLRGMGVEVIVLGQSAAIPSIGAFVALVRAFQRLRPLVVHCHGGEANFHGLLAARLTGVPVRLGEEIGIPGHSFRAKFVFRQIYRSADKVIAISEAVKRWLVANSEVPERKAVRIYNPVRFAPHTARGSSGWMSLRIGFVGRLHPVKNAEVLLGAIANLRQEGVCAELVVVGDGPQLDQLKGHAEFLAIAHQVRFVGFHSDPISFLSNCDIYVQPSLAEGFGNALVEAMGAGLPVIATRVGGTPEIVEEGRTGWLVEPTVEGVSAALAAASRLDRSELQRMGQAARASVVGRFEPSVYLKELESLYKSVARQKGISFIADH